MSIDIGVVLVGRGRYIHEEGRILHNFVHCVGEFFIHERVGKEVKFDLDLRVPLVLQLG